MFGNSHFHTRLSNEKAAHVTVLKSPKSLLRTHKTCINLARKSRHLLPLNAPGDSKRQFRSLPRNFPPTRHFAQPHRRSSARRGLSISPQRKTYIRYAPPASLRARPEPRRSPTPPELPSHSLGPLWGVDESSSVVGQDALFLRSPQRPKVTIRRTASPSHRAPKTPLLASLDQRALPARRAPGAAVARTPSPARLFNLNQAAANIPDTRAPSPPPPRPLPDTHPPALRILTAASEGQAHLAMPTIEAGTLCDGAKTVFFCDDNRTRTVPTLLPVIPVLPRPGKPVSISFPLPAGRVAPRTFWVRVRRPDADKARAFALPKKVELTWGSERATAVLSGEFQTLTVRRPPHWPEEDTQKESPQKLSVVIPQLPRPMAPIPPIGAAAQGPLRPATFLKNRNKSPPGAGAQALAPRTSSVTPRPDALVGSPLFLSTGKNVFLRDFSPSTPSFRAPPGSREDSGSPRGERGGSNPAAHRSPASPLVPAALPRAKRIQFSITSTWGDEYYVGLSGIELFDSNGHLIEVRPYNVDADPRDINVLPEYKSDPRVPKNVFDGSPCTCSDQHMWLAPFEQGSTNVLTVAVVRGPSDALNGGWPETLDDFPPKHPDSISEASCDFSEPIPAKAIGIGAIRVWNYNKSRVHASRGARAVRISFDGIEVWNGEFRKASGHLLDASTYTTWIWLTASELYKEAVRANSTAHESLDELPLETGKQLFSIETCSQGKKAALSSVRPFTSAVLDLPFEKTLLSSAIEVQRTFTIRVLSTWGDQYYLGLTGVSLIDACGQVVRHIEASACPEDLNIIPGHAGDHRVPSNLLSSCNVTTDDRHMWLAPSTLSPFERPQTITLTLRKPSRISLLLVWNYNKSAADTHRGVREVLLFADDRLLSLKPTVFRKAPGHAHSDFVQQIPLIREESRAGDMESITRPTDSILRSDVDFSDLTPAQTEHGVLPAGGSWAPVLPGGYVLDITVLSAYSDRTSPVGGLDGLEILDANGRALRIDGNARTMCTPAIGLGESCWRFHPSKHLPSATAARPARLVGNVSVLFHHPVTLGGIRFQNLARGGAADIQVSLDGCLIFSGRLARGCAVQTLALSRALVKAARSREDRLIADPVSAPIKLFEDGMER
eukprot:gnl/Chilomastix_cuspidata/2473.p1 GENE.gnl/Chilomastix_cuspidata/2473~~gnl/Chilomastix_cuspidata/2473.p1  ORF type:complete len:1122 (-),score=107.29 gnl/Chilomastix_cuspidata/2473:982-4347(-)